MIPPLGRRPMRLAAVAMLWAGAVQAQRPPSGLQPELRLDALLARDPAVQAGVGVGIAAGSYLRLGAVVAAGAAHARAAGGGAELVASTRAEVVARYLFDPFRQFGRGVYAGGGVGVRRDGSGPWNELLVLVAGVEGRPRRGVAPAAELGVGGGVRLGVVLRRARATGR